MKLDLHDHHLECFRRMDQIKYNIYEEWVIFETPEELEQATIYLELWKKFFLKKFNFKILKHFKIEKKDNAWDLGKHEIKMILKLEDYPINVKDVEKISDG